MSEVTVVDRRETDVAVRYHASRAFPQSSNCGNYSRGDRLTCISDADSENAAQALKATGGPQ